MKAKMSIHFESEDPRGTGYNEWDESKYPQGSVGEVFRIWKVEFTDDRGSFEALYFKQLGVSDSYAYQVEWQDKMVQVEAKPRVVTQFDYTEV